MKSLIPLHKGAFGRCCGNRRDVILFSAVRKITASRESWTTAGRWGHENHVAW